MKWKLNEMTIIKSNMNKVSSSTYMLESSNIWHGRLRHTNYDALRIFINLDHIPTFQICDTPIPGGPVDHRQLAETCVSHIMRPIHE